MNTTLPTDSNDRKNYALFRGCINYFPAALAGVAKTSKLGNDKHNPGQDMHHARNKSQDHGDCIVRHLMDVADLLAAVERGETISKELILSEVSSMAWRALAFSQEVHEKFGSPLAPGAKVDLYPTVSADKPKSNLPVFGPGVDLWNAAEKAQEEVKQMVEDNKKNIFNIDITKKDKIEKAKKLFSKGDVVKHINNDVEVTVEALYYNENGDPVLFVRDSDGKIFGVDPNFYKSIYVERKA